MNPPAAGAHAAPRGQGDGRPPLAGRTVAVTRARAQAADLVEALERLGATVIEAPTIEFAEPSDWGSCDAALDRLDAYDWIVFTSRNTLPRLAARMRARGLDPATLARGPARIAAVGESTAAGLGEAGLPVALVPATFRAAAVADALVAAGVAGRRVFVPQAEVAAGELAARLREAGAEVDAVAVYRTVAVAGGLDAVRAALLAGRCDAITFTSGSTVDAFLAGLGLPHPGLEAALKRACLASIGPVTSDELRHLGWPPTVEAQPSTIPGLVAALVTHYRIGGATGGTAAGPQREEPAR